MVKVRAALPHGSTFLCTWSTSALRFRFEALCCLVGTVRTCSPLWIVADYDLMEDYCRANLHSEESALNAELAGGSKSPPPAASAHATYGSVYGTCILCSFRLTSKPALHIFACCHCSLQSLSRCRNSCSSICCNSYSKNRRKNILNDAEAPIPHGLSS